MELVMDASGRLNHSGIGNSLLSCMYNLYTNTQEPWGNIDLHSRFGEELAHFDY